MLKWMAAFACLFSYKVSALSPKAQLKAFFIAKNNQHLGDDISEFELEGSQDLNKSFFEISQRHDLSYELRLTAALTIGWNSSQAPNLISQLFRSALKDNEPLQLREIWMDLAALMAIQTQEGLKLLISELLTVEDDELIYDYLNLFYRAHQISERLIFPSLDTYLAARNSDQLKPEKQVRFRLFAFDQSVASILKNDFENEKDIQVRRRMVLMLSGLQFSKPKKQLIKIELTDPIPLIRTEAYISLIQMSGWREQNGSYFNRVLNSATTIKIRAQLICAELLNPSWAEEAD